MYYKHAGMGVIKEYTNSRMTYIAQERAAAMNKSHRIGWDSVGNTIDTINKADTFITSDSYRARNDCHKYRRPDHIAGIR